MKAQPMETSAALVVSLLGKYGESYSSTMFNRGRVQLDYLEGHWYVLSIYVVDGDVLPMRQLAVV